MSLVVQIIMYLIIDTHAPQESRPYVPKQKRKPRHQLSLFMSCTLPQCIKTVTAQVDQIKVRRHYQIPGLHYYGYRHRRKKKKLVPQASLTGMTTTWNSPSFPSQGTFDSDAQALMLDNGASACITKHKAEFIEPPKQVVTCFYRCLGYVLVVLNLSVPKNHHFVMTSSWEPQCHHDIIMRTPRITGKPKFSWSGGP